ncbi:peptide MFS transporter [Corynebacterium freneyi]|uniref:peptide MFS transporter n=1 Tax=Corynebacterium freneyi TaxID=134034 RepID=UPI000AF47805|nr:oligopeptide:H+ symporter [Corynebacterium freneyi]
MTSTGQRSSGVLSPPGTSRTRPPGHARIALPAIIGVESWERFSFYGMQAIMVYYLYAATADGGLGLPTATATALMGAYGSLVYLCTIAGGWIGDRVLGAERTLLAGAWVLVAGHLTLSLVPGAVGVAIGMVFVAAGSGALKTSAITMLGCVRTDGDPRRDNDFQFFYFGINVGGLLGPVLTGALSVSHGFDVGFAAAAILMSLGLVHYHWHRGRLSASWRDDVRGDVERPTSPITRRALVIVASAVAGIVATTVWFTATGILHLQRLPTVMLAATMAATVGLFAQMLLDPDIERAERRRVLAFIPLFIAAVAFWSIHNQAFGALAVYSDLRIDRTIGDWTAPAAWAQSLNPVFTLLLILPLAALRLRMGRRAPDIPIQMIVGTAVTGCAMLIMVPFAGIADGAVPLLVIVAVYLAVTLGELQVSPVGMAASTVLAPAKYRTRFSALYFLTMAVGTALSGVLSTRYDPTDSGAERMYFLSVGIGVIAVAAVAATVLPWIRRLIAGDPDSMAAPTTAGVETPAAVEPPQTPTPGSCR